MKPISGPLTPCFVFLLVTAVHLRAATITVTNTAESGAGTLRAALASANNGDTINFALPLPSTVVVSGGILAVNKRVAILGPGPTNLIVQGGGSSELFYLSAPANNNNITIAGLTIANGFTTLNGAGIYNSGCNLTVSNVVLVGNTAFGEGGGIFNDGAYASAALTIVNSTIRNNSAGSGGAGAGISNSAQNTNNASVTISNCTIVGNESGDVGGGIANAAASGGTANLTVLNSTLIGNFASSGAGIWNEERDRTSEANLSITNSTLSGNSASSGAGICNIAGTLVVSDSVVSSNVANNNCGGVYNVAYDPGKVATAQIVRSVVSSNSAVLGTGGGIRNLSYSQATVRLTVLDSTLVGNSAGGDGGGIQNDNTADATAILGITNSTLSGNSSAIGGGIENLKGSSGTSTVWIANCTLSGDTAPAGSSIYNQRGTVQFGSTILNETSSAAISNNLGSVISLGYNLCSHNGGGFLSNTTDQINTDPMLGPLQDNGGPAFTHAPLPGSPAIDAGKNFSGATDQRGFRRTLDIAGLPNAGGGDGTDIGAVEFQDASLRLIKVGVVSNEFGFNLTGPFTNVVVEACNLPSTNWTALATNTLGDAAVRFNDSTAPTPPKRFYRAREQ
jgi:hypothetical protein